MTNMDSDFRVAKAERQRRLAKERQRHVTHLPVLLYERVPSRKALDRGLHQIERMARKKR